MVKFDEFKEQIQERLKDIWVKVQESSTFISLKEKYDNLAPSVQKSLRTGVICAFVGFVFWILWGLFSHSSERLTEFEEYQDSIKELLQLKRDMALTPQIISPPNSNVLKQRVNMILQSFYLNPDQIDEISARDVDPSSFVQVPGKKSVTRVGSKVIQQKGVWISLKSLNLKQVTDIGFQLQTIHDAVKLIGLDMKASIKHNNYYDVMYTIIGFYPSVDSENKK